MADAPRTKYRKPFPVRKIILYTGVALIALGYGFLSVPPESGIAVAQKRAFTGIGLVMAGAVLWLGAIFFND